MQDYIINSKEPEMNYFQYNSRKNNSTRYCGLDIKKNKNMSWDVLISETELSAFNIMVDIADIASTILYGLLQSCLLKNEKEISWHLLKMHAIDRKDNVISDRKLYKASFNIQKISLFDPNIKEIDFFSSPFNLNRFSI